MGIKLKSVELFDISATMVSLLKAGSVACAWAVARAHCGITRACPILDVGVVHISGRFPVVAAAIHPTNLCSRCASQSRAQDWWRRYDFLSEFALSKLADAVWGLYARLESSRALYSISCGILLLSNRRERYNDADTSVSIARERLDNWK